MGMMNRETWKGLLATTLLVAGSIAGVACGGDDSSSGSTTNQTPIDGGGSTSSGGSSGATSSSGGSSGMTSSSGGSSGGSSGTPDSGVDAAPLVAAATPTFTPAAGTFTSAQSVTIASTTAGAQIFYTVDGTNPTTASPVYSSALSISQTTTIRAIATATGFTQSAVAVGTFTINIPAGTTVAPTFSPAAGTYPNSQSVGLASTTSGATVCYTLDGTDPACTNGTCSGTSATYSAATPISVTAAGTKIRALACKSGNTNSTIAEAIYNFKAADPTASPSGGVQPSGTVITLSTVTTNGQIHYTTDGSTPTCLTPSPINQTGTIPAITTNKQVKAVVCRSGYANSDVETFDYEVRAGAPTISPASGTFGDTVAVSIAAGTNGTIHCYTTDNTAPACTTAGCTTGIAGTAFNVTKDNVTVRAVSCGAANIQSPEDTKTYRLKVNPISVNGDTTTTFFATTNASEQVTLATTTPGAKICYRTDGVSPGCTIAAGPVVNCAAGSTTYSAPFTPNTPFTVKAIGCKLDYQDSADRTATFADPTSTVGLSVTPDPDTYNNDQTITMTATPADATICYQMGAETLPDPVCNVTTGACTTGQTYSAAAKPVVTADGTWVKATACKVGIANAAAVQQGIYHLQVAIPAANPPGDTYPYGTGVTFSSTTTGAEFHRTTGFPNAATPTCSTGTVGNSYTVNVLIEEVKVIGCKAGYLPSTVLATAYGHVGELGAPTITPASGTYWNNQTANLSTVSKDAPGAVICYTTDGTTPSCAPGSNVCSGPVGSNVLSGAAAGFNVPINQSTTLRAITCANGFDNSATTSRIYELAVSPLEVNPAGGSFTSAVSPVITQKAAPPEQTTGASICYTTNGNEPTCATDVISGTTCSATTSVNLNFTSTKTLKFKGCKSGYTTTSTTTETYSIGAYARTINIDGAIDFVDGENAIATSAGGHTSYVSWDSNNVYFGLKGSGVGAFNNSHYVHFYVRAGGSPSTTTTADTLGGTEFGSAAIPTAVSHHIIWRTDNGNTLVRYWNGTQWVNAGAIGLQVASGGINADSYIEFAVPRGGGAPTGLNNPTTLILVGALTAAGTNTVGFPSTVFTKWLEADLSSFQAPNTASYIKP